MVLPEVRDQELIRRRRWRGTRPFPLFCPVPSCDGLLRALLDVESSPPGMGLSCGTCDWVTRSHGKGLLNLRNDKAYRMLWKTVLASVRTARTAMAGPPPTRKTWTSSALTACAPRPSRTSA